MKTAMQQLIEDIENREYNYLDVKLLSFANSIQEKAKELLEAEKEQIKNSYSTGAMDASYDFDNVDSEKYYQQTFKSDE